MIITRDDLTFKRPAHGVSPKNINQVIGKELTDEVDEDTPVEWYMVK